MTTQKGSAAAALVCARNRVKTASHPPPLSTLPIAPILTRGEGLVGGVKRTLSSGVTANNESADGEGEPTVVKALARRARVPWLRERRSESPFSDIRFWPGGGRDVAPPVGEMHNPPFS